MSSTAHESRTLDTIEGGRKSHYESERPVHTRDVTSAPTPAHIPRSAARTGPGHRAQRRPHSGNGADPAPVARSIFETASSNVERGRHLYLTVLENNETTLMLPGKMRTATPISRDPGAKSSRSHEASGRVQHGYACERCVGAARTAGERVLRRRRRPRTPHASRHDLSTRRPSRRLSPPELIATTDRPNRTFFPSIHFIIIILCCRLF